MILIKYTNDTIENEPGPNFYWRGTPLDFLQLTFDLHALGKDKVEINLQRLDYIQIEGQYNVIVKSTENGKILCDIKGDTLIIDLNNELWREVLVMFLNISYYSSHNYVDFDENASECANFIISSEGQ